jgi:hypothetical protein
VPHRGRRLPGAPRSRDHHSGKAADSLGEHAVGESWQVADVILAHRGSAYLNRTPLSTRIAQAYLPDSHRSRSRRSSVCTFGMRDVPNVHTRAAGAVPRTGRSECTSGTQHVPNMHPLRPGLDLRAGAAQRAAVGDADLRRRRVVGEGPGPRSDVERRQHLVPLRAGILHARCATQPSALRARQTAATAPLRPAPSVPLTGPPTGRPTGPLTGPPAAAARRGRPSRCSARCC